MNGSELRDGLESSYETELSRLGSSKTIYAATEGEMDTDAVLDAMADRTRAAAETFDGWTADTTDTVLADIYGSIAANLHEEVTEITEIGGEAHDRPTGLEQYLRTLDTPSERAGGLLAWALVRDELLSQAVGFFVGNADPSSADTFRDIRSELDDELARIESLLEETYEDATVWERAEESAAQAIEAAYDHYVETLEDLGVKVKPVC